MGKADKRMCVGKYGNSVYRSVTVFFFALLLIGCVSFNSVVGTQTPIVETLVDPHHHVIDVSKSTIGADQFGDFHMVASRIPTDLVVDDSATNSNGTARVSTACDQKCGIYMEDLASNTTYEFSFPWFTSRRPFDDIAWISDQIVVFDQWTQPNYGIHYAVDVMNKRLLLASPFPDKLP